MFRSSYRLTTIMWLLGILYASLVLAEGDEGTDTLAPVTEPTATPPSASRAHPTQGAVASENSDCSNLGARVIEEGGNAADAMITTVLCTGVKSPGHSGIGGGGFMLVRDPRNGSYEYIDFRETAPAYAHADMYKHWSKMNSTTGGAARSGSLVSILSLP
jgi:gamma-glutamyltranspeptidase